MMNHINDTITIDPSSFRDPAGFVFRTNGQLYRQINDCYGATYEYFIASGLYELLKSKGMIVAHQEIKENLCSQNGFFLLLKPEQIPFISYPYEWCFSQMKEAALLTLELQLQAMHHGMSLKDATPYNIQFKKSRPILIDSLSFEKYDETKPWVAYRQFCEMFLNPLLLEHYCRIEAMPLLKHHFTGISAATTASLLPWKSKWNLGVRLHVMLQAGFKHTNVSEEPKKIAFSRQKMLNLIHHLISVVKGLSSGYPEKSGWNNYYEATILGEQYLASKKALIYSWIQHRNWERVLDLGANDGFFSKLIASRAALVIATDFDAPCIERLYNSLKNTSSENILPLVLDLANPSPAIGFANRERPSFLNRSSSSGLVLALALIHHLCITKGISLPQIASFFSSLGEELMVEFVPREDEKAKVLLSSQTHDFSEYTLENFEEAMDSFFVLITRERIEHSVRRLYHYKRK